MNNEIEQHAVRIHINRESFKSPNPTTGEALYLLGNIAADEKLFREVDGDNEDRPVVRDDDRIELKADGHFYSQKRIEILVNGDEHEIGGKEISYTQVVDLFLGSGSTASTEYPVKYSHGPLTNPSGTLAPEQKVLVKDGMRFRVAGTGES